MITFSNSFWDFIMTSDSRIARFIKNVHNHRYYEYLYNLALTDAEIDYLTLRKGRTISYLPAGKEHIINGDGTWAREGRQNGKPSKVIRKILTKNAQKLFSDKDFENFACSYKASCEMQDMTFTEYDRHKIPDVYSMCRESGSGSLNQSCMNDDRDYVFFYTGIKEVSIIAMTNPKGELTGRALLWETPDGKLMDRVYVTKEHYYEMFIEYAKEKGYIRKVYYKSYDYKDLFTSPTEGEFNSHYKFEFDDSIFDEYPYIDTFTYGDDGYITNKCTGDYEYSNTDGTRNGDDEDQRWDELNGRYIHYDDAIYIERGRYNGYYIHEEDAACVDGDWWWSGDDNIIWVGCKYYHIDDCTIVNGTWYLSEDCVFCEADGDDYLKEDCTQLHDGTWCLDSDAVEVEGLYYHKDSIPC